MVAVSICCATQHQLICVYWRLYEYSDTLLVRTNGSHYIFMKQGVTARISVPVHASKVLKRGLQRHLMKIAQIDESEL